VLSKGSQAGSPFISGPTRCALLPGSLQSYDDCRFELTDLSLCSMYSLPGRQLIIPCEDLNYIHVVVTKPITMELHGVGLLYWESMSIPLQLDWRSSLRTVATIQYHIESVGLHDRCMATVNLLLGGRYLLYGPTGYLPTR
jgi:hypothetical protein